MTPYWQDERFRWRGEMNAIPGLVHAANCPVGGNFACTCGAEDAANARLTDAVTAYSRLREMTPQVLVNLALEHMPDMPYAYEQVVEELCTRVYPNWSNEDPPTVETRAKPTNWFDGGYLNNGHCSFMQAMNGWHYCCRLPHAHDGPHLADEGRQSKTGDVK